MSVSVAATSPPVQDSAVAILSLRSRQRSSSARAVVDERRVDHSSLHGSRTVALAKATMPSPRPVKPIFSLVVALIATRATRQAGDLGDARTDGVAMRADARRLAHDGDVEMRDASAARAHPLDREGQKAVGGGAPPLRIARRKVHADIAVRNRAQQGVDERMKHHVRVRMSGQSALKGTRIPPSMT